MAHVQLDFLRQIQMLQFWVEWSSGLLEGPGARGEEY